MSRAAPYEARTEGWMLCAQSMSSSPAADDDGMSLPFPSRGACTSACGSSPAAFHTSHCSRCLANASSSFKSESGTVEQPYFFAPPVPSWTKLIKLEAADKTPQINYRNAARLLRTDCLPTDVESCAGNGHCALCQPIFAAGGNIHSHAPRAKSMNFTGQGLMVPSFSRDRALAPICLAGVYYQSCCHSL